MDHTLFHVGREYSSIAVLGDFNLPDVDWRRPDLARGSDADFVHLMIANGLSQINFIPSTIHMHVLDLIFTSHIDLIMNVFKIDDCFYSDHAVLSFDLCTYCEPTNEFKRIVYNYKRVDLNNLSSALGKDLYLINAIISSENVNEMWQLWSNAFFNTLDATVPKISLSVNSKDPPWFDGEARHSINVKRTAWRKAKSKNTPAAWANFRAVRNRTTQLLKDKQKAFIDSLSIACKKNPKRFWSYFKHKSKSGSIPAEVCHNESRCSSSAEKSELFNSYFASVFTPTQNVPFISPVCACSVNPIPEPVFTCDQVINVLSNLDVNSACGPDNISPLVLKNCSYAIAPSLTIVFNSSLQSGTVPNSWKCANVVPIFKKGDKCQVSNYRPISLISTIDKAMERCVFDHLYPLVEGRLHPLQHGFCKGRSCTTQLIQVYHQIGSVLDKGGQVDMIFLDFSKAFDCVSHPLLLYKLRTFYGVDGVLLSWISDYLSNRSQRVVIENSSSAVLPVLSGVPQGSILGPLLFLLYINDLPSVTSNCITALFADDSKCFTEIRSYNDCNLLQNDLDKLVEWSNTWEMDFNASKCKVLTITRCHSPVQYCYTINGSPLEKVGVFKDLGVFIDETLSFNSQVDQLVLKCNKVCGFIKRSVGFKAPNVVKLRLYKALCLSILDYCSPVWSPQSKQNIKKLESVQRSMSRFLLNNTEISYPQRCVDLRILPLSFRREMNDLILIFNCMYGSLNVDFTNFISVVSLHNHRSINGVILRSPSSQPRTETFMSSFFNRIIHLWNRLPSSIRNCTSSSVFKQKILHFYIDQLDSFNPDNSCTWTSTCRCQGFYHF